ncbi:MAG TPA: protein-disulfide reductase DsbD domain-containing protein [Candidatus Acidoferrales bacterium]|nr:protein-disulfide reductase DsbD domain-containing protein [Candidatus Acidoferrales bacterium]
MFPELGEEVASTTEAPHLRLALEQSDRTAFPGGIVTLTAEVQLPPDVHVYAPGTQDYKPIKLVIDPASEIELRAAIYPASKTLFLPAIKERVPVFTGAFRIREDVKISSAAEFSNALGNDGKPLTITGKLEYQACDSKICFLPESVPVQWHVQALPLDRQRAPEEIRHK